MDDFLAQLSSSMLDRKSQRRSADALSSLSNLEVQVKSRQDDNHERVERKDNRDATSPVLPTKPQVDEALKEALKALPSTSKIDVRHRLGLENDAKEASVDTASDGLDRMMNRRHPLRQRRKLQKMMCAQVMLPLEEKRMLYPGGISSLGDSGIGVAY